MEPLERKKLADSIRELRLKQGLRQIDLVVAGQVARSTISALERGQIENPSEHLIDGVASMLSVRRQDLLMWPKAEASVLEDLKLARASQQRSPQVALRRAQRALIRARRLQLSDVERSAAELLAELHSQLGHPVAATTYAGWAVAHPNRFSPVEHEAVIVYGERLRNIGELSAAIALYRQFLAGISRNSSRSAKVFLRLGQTYADAHQYPQAMRIFQRAYRDALVLGDANLSGWALIGLSVALSFSGRHQQAEDARVRAAILAQTYHWTDMQYAARRAEEQVAVLSSPSLDAARHCWQQSTRVIEELAGAIDDQLQLLYSWVFYASNHQAWAEVIEATGTGLALIRRADHRAADQQMKGTFLGARARAKQQSGQSWQDDKEWAEDLLYRGQRTPVSRLKE
ncbi:MAG: helix-turn-helix domain-containing protein [Firmicutes bacterium]|nr:helix-turn-helix domain-containing protein [Bacillota bacterium]